MCQELGRLLDQRMHSSRSRLILVRPSILRERFDQLSIYRLRYAAMSGIS
jgi:hypothetical protein